MSRIQEDVCKLIQAVTERSVSYLKDEMELDVQGIDSQLENVKSLTLRSITALVSVGGNLGLYLAFSFEDAVIRRIFEAYTDDIDVAPEEEDEYIEETAGDVINTVVGNALATMSEGGQTISLTPPVVIAQARSLVRQKDAYFYKADLKTDTGVLSVMCIGPGDIFDEKLNYKGE